MANIGRCFPLLVALLLTVASATCAQRFSLETKGDSLSYLVLTTDSTTDRHRLPFPVYRFCTGDVDGDGETNVYDVTFIQRYVVDLPTPYPIGEFITK